MSVSAKVYAPECQVLLLKNIWRTTTNGTELTSARYAGAQRVIDLSPWLSDKSSIITSKSVREPAGSFQITFSDKVSIIDLDSLYGLLEPMDLVEIRFSHEPWETKLKNGKLPIVMRGFISNITRSESIGSDGVPQRRLTISGQDYGKIWQLMQIFYFPNYTVGATLLTEYKFFDQYGIGFGVEKGRDFLKSVISKIINPYIIDMQGLSSSGSNLTISPIMQISTKDADIQTGDAIVSPFSINSANNITVYNLLATYLDVGPFCELFLQDREDGVYCVYRQNPFYDLNGNKIPEVNGVPGFTNPATIDVLAGDITVINVSRGDAHVANFFWVRSPQYDMNFGPLIASMSAQGDATTFFITNYGNDDPKLYGPRKMEETTNMGYPTAQFNGDGLPIGTNKQQEVLSGNWATDRRKQLIAQNKDNVVFESGTISIIGNEGIQAGIYINLIRGSMVAKYYVVQVDHRYVPFSGFWTNLIVERGTGFVERIKRGNGAASPYYSEMVDPIVVNK